MLIASACGTESKKEGQTAADSTAAAPKATPQMQPSSASPSDKLGGKEYSFQINRKPDSTLPQVRTSDGSPYMDNSVELTITQGGTQVLQRQFTKKDFSAVIGANFLESAILEGFVYDHVENGKFLFAASVCVPTTDLYVPVRVLISAQGTVSIEKDNSADIASDDSGEGME